MTAERIRVEAGLLGRLAAPIVIGQLSQVGMGVTDTVMAGRLGAVDLAAIAIGSTLWLPVYLAGLGVLMAGSTLTARLWGAGRQADIGGLFRQTVWLAAALGLAGMALTRHVAAVLPWLKIDSLIVPISTDYLAAVAWGIPGACAYLTMRFLGEGTGHTRAIMYIQSGALVANAGGNYLLMYGALGAPALGAVGAGWSTAAVMWLSAAAMGVYVTRHPHFGRLVLFRGPWRPEPARLAAVLRLGVPIAATTLMEVGMFAAVSLLMGSLGTVAVAGHQIALNYASLVFMVPLGLSLATTVRVGQAMGRNDPGAARLAGAVGIAMAFAVMLVSAGVMLAFPEYIVALYTGDREVAAMAVELLAIAALFQISDGIQVGSVGALRGLKDTTRPMLINFVSYWLVGLPLAYALGISRALGPGGLWIGLVAGLTVAAVWLAGRFHRLSRRIAHPARR